MTSSLSWKEKFKSKLILSKQNYSSQYRLRTNSHQTIRQLSQVQIIYSQSINHNQTKNNQIHTLLLNLENRATLPPRKKLRKMLLLKSYRKNGKENPKDQTLKKMVSMQKIHRIRIIVEIKVLFKVVMQKLKATEFYIFTEMLWKFLRDLNFMKLLKKCI